MIIFSILLILFASSNSRFIKETKKKVSLKPLKTTFPIFGNTSELSYYYIDVFIGDSKTKQSLILDTGSHFTALPCQPLCTSCGQHLNSYYSIAGKKIEEYGIRCQNDACPLGNSYSCVNGFCNFETTFAEGSAIKGVFYDQKISINQDMTSLKNFTLGCIASEKGSFYNQKADGIIGLSKESIGFSTQMKKNGFIKKNIFSICFGLNGGYLSLGGIDPTFHRSQVQYTNMVGTLKNFDLRLNSISVNVQNKSSFNTSSLITLIDSGSTLMYFPSEIFEQTKEKIKEGCRYHICSGEYEEGDKGICFKLKNGKIPDDLKEIFPSITFTFDGEVDYVIHSEDYAHKIEENEVCVGIAKWTKKEILLGGNFMHNHDIIFDIENKRIGFAVSDCSKISLLPCKEGVFNNLKKFEDSLLYAILLLSLIAISMGTSIYFLRQGKSFLCFKFNSLRMNEVTSLVGQLSEIQVTQPSPRSIELPERENKNEQSGNEAIQIQS